MEQLNKNFWWLLDFLHECHYFSRQHEFTEEFKKDLDTFYKIKNLYPLFTEEYFTAPEGESFELHTLLTRLEKNWDTILPGFHFEFQEEVKHRYWVYMKSYEGFLSNGI